MVLHEEVTHYSNALNLTSRVRVYGLRLSVVACVRGVIWSLTFFEGFLKGGFRVWGSLLWSLTFFKGF